jgi:acetyl esterase
LAKLDPRLRQLIAQDEPGAGPGGLTAADVRAADAAVLSLQRPARALLALATRCLIIAPDIRLAPEHPFPAAHEDALACARWTHAHAQELAGGASVLGIAGDSSGGNLAAATTRDLTRQRTSPAFQMLIYPMLDATASSASYRELGVGYGFTREKSLWYFGQYLPDGSDRRDPRISPLLERDLTGLPPTLVITAEYDPLRDDGEHYARAIRDAGGLASLRRYDGMIHGFIQMTGYVNAASQVQADIAAWISKQTSARISTPRRASARRSARRRTHRPSRARCAGRTPGTGP